MAQKSLRAVDKSRRTLIFPSEPAPDHDAAQAEPQPLAERFNWMREVGRSARGTIYHAEARGEGLFTVEVLADEAAADAKQVEVFYLEAEAAARLEHPHIVKAFTAEPIAGTHLRRIAFMRGTETLRQLLVRVGWFDPGHALRLTAQIAQALDYAHQARVLHLNLDPEHIFLDSDGRVQVAGFGLATDEPRPWVRQLRVSKCAPPYLSPEQLNGAPGVEASDLYALGVICYEMLSDRIPFDSNDVEHLRRRHRTQTPQPPHNLRPGLPLEPSRAVMELLERDPEQRVHLFNGAGGLRTALRLAYDLETAPPKATAARYTNPMPLFEIAAELAESKLEAQMPAPPAPLPEKQPVELAPPVLETDHQTDTGRHESAGPVFVPPPLIRADHQAELAPPPGEDSDQAAAQLPPEGNPLAAQAPPRNDQSTSYYITHPSLVTRARPRLKYIYLTLIILTMLPLIWWAFASSRHATSDGQPTPSPSPIAVADAPTTVASSTDASSPDAMSVAVKPDDAAGDGAATDEAAPQRATNKESAPDKLRSVNYGAPIKRVNPNYPSSARARQVAGSVIVKVAINKNGNVTKAEAIAGPLPLRAAAEAAARGWKFKPSTVNGRPVSVTSRIAINFNLPRR